MKSIAQGTQWEKLVDDFLNKMFDFENAVKAYKQYQGSSKDKAEELLREAKSKNAALLMCVFEWQARHNPNDKIISQLRAMAINAYNMTIFKL